LNQRGTSRYRGLHIIVSLHFVSVRVGILFKVNVLPISPHVNRPADSAIFTESMPGEHLLYPQDNQCIQHPKKSEQYSVTVENPSTSCPSETTTMLYRVHPGDAQRQAS